MSTHDTIQTQLLEGARTGEVDEHLAGCEECLRLDADLTAIRHNAPHVGGGAPAGLADRVIERVRDEAPIETASPSAPGAMSTAAVAAGTTAPRGSSEWIRRSAHRSLAMAAALLVLVGAVAVLNHGGDEEPLDVLLASATRTEAAGPAEVQVAGDATVTLDTGGDPGEAPDLSSVPPELQGYVLSRFQEIMALWHQQMADFEARVDATLEEAERLIDQQMGRIGEMFDRFGDAPSSPPPPPDRRGQSTPPAGWSAGEPSAPAPPTDVTLGFDISASGRLDPGRAIRLQGGVASDRGGRSDFEVRSRSDVAGVLVDGSWRAAAGAGSLLDTVLARADGAPAVLRAAVDAELVGETEVDGAAVRHYRFAVDPGEIGRIAGAAAGADSGRWTAEAWIDDDDLLRRLDVRAAGRFDPTGVAGWAMDLSLRLSGFGSVARLQVDGPPAGATVDGTASTSVFGPFMPALAASLRGTATAD